MELWVRCVAGALQDSEYTHKLTNIRFTGVEIEPTRIYDIEDARQFLTTSTVREWTVAFVFPSAATMDHALYHSGYSPVLRESKDGTAGLADADGRVVIIGGGLQYHSLGYEQAVRSVLMRYPRETLRPGDSFIVNDPYWGGNPHAPDMVAVTPGFHEGVLVGYGVSIAHKADIGGLVPGEYLLEIDLVHEGVRWFGRGARVPATVEPAARPPRWWRR